MRIILLLLNLLCCFSITYAQGILKGTITIKENGKPLKGVAVTAVGLSNKAYTDDNGYFMLECKGMSAGDVLSLIVTKENYVVVDKEALRDVTLRKDAKPFYNFIMQEEIKRKSDIEKEPKQLLMPWVKR